MKYTVSLDYFQHFSARLLPNLWLSYKESQKSLGLLSYFINYRGGGEAGYTEEAIRRRSSEQNIKGADLSMAIKLPPTNQQDGINEVRGLDLLENTG